MRSGAAEQADVAVACAFERSKGCKEERSIGEIARRYPTQERRRAKRLKEREKARMRRLGERRKAHAS